MSDRMSSNVVTLAGRRALRKTGFTPAYEDPRRFARLAFREPSLWQRLQAEHPMLFDAASLAIMAAAFFFLWIATPQ